MAARPRPLAKLTRPKLYGAVPRPRLFALLDDAATRPIVWISAPPGSGKSTLVASWLEARARPHVWYQVDVGDADPATFVHYMREAALRLAGKAAAALPLFTSEPQQNLARFARGFFRDLFALLPASSIIVLDNFHEAETTPETRHALAQAFEEIPEGIAVVVVSRSEPPAEFARLAAGLRIARIAPMELRCTADETTAIFGSRHGPEVDRVLTQSDGWVAALVLLREHLARAGDARAGQSRTRGSSNGRAARSHEFAIDEAIDEALGEGKLAIFQYFAGEIFAGARPGNQRILMLTSLPPSFTQREAVALSGDDDAPRLLEYLYRRHLFVDRRLGRETTYHYHALFREFLQEEAARQLSPDARRAALAHAAALLAERGQVSEALGLYRDAREWEPMRALIHAQALEWARQGRSQALSDWIDALPHALRDADAWLSYWQGRAWIFVEPDRGRPALAHAFERFAATDDLRGQIMALATIVTGYYYEWARFDPLDALLPQFERLLAAAETAALDDETRMRLHAAHVIALLFRRPEDPALAASAERLGALLDHDGNVNVRMMAASTLFNYLNWTEDGARAGALVARMTPVVHEPEVTPLMQVWWRTHLSFWHYLNGRYDDATAAAVAARDIAARYGLEAYLFEIDHADASALISRGDLAAAGELLDAMEKRLSPLRRMDWAYFHLLRSSHAQRTGRATAAVMHAEKAVAFARETGLPAMQLPHFLARLAQARLAAGQRDAALAAFDETIVLSSSAERATFERQRTLARIVFAIDDGRTDDAKAELAQALGSARARGQLVFWRSRPDLAARIVNFALAHGIEPDFARTLITENGLQAPPDAVDDWPHRLRVDALGGFAITRDGVAMRFSGKAQQRPLDLLKLVIALGGSGVDAERVTAQLWPDADGASAKTSFDTTLFRLRKLLDVEGAVVLAAGKLSLAPTLVWTDVGLLQRTLDALDADGVHDADTARAAERLLAAWKGPLLGDADETWITQPREALRARCVRVAMRLGEQLERRADWPAAIALYRRGLDADNLSEPLYRGLMRALAAHGDAAEALNVFRRCRELLSIVLGVKPAIETERLRDEIATGRRSLA